MATVIKIKNSGTSGSPSSLGTGELAYSYLAGTQSNGGDRVYIGTGTETNGAAANIEVIGGKYFTQMLDHVAGTRTNSSAVLVGSNGKIDVWDVDNLKLDGNTLSSTDSNGDINVTPNGSGSVVLDGQSFPQADGSAGQFLKTDGSGQLSWGTVVSTLTLSADTGSDDTINTGETLTFTGTDGVDTAVSNNTITFSLDDSELRGKFSATDSGGDGSFSYNSSTGAFTYTGPSAAETRAHLGGGTGVTYNSSTGTISIGQAVGTGDDVEFNDLTLAGNLVVNGTTTTVNSTVVQIDDPIMTLGGDTAPTSDDGKDRGLEFRYYSGSAKLGFMGWDNSSGGFVLYKDATNSSEVFSGTAADITLGTVTGTEFIGTVDGGTY